MCQSTQNPITQEIAEFTAKPVLIELHKCNHADAIGGSNGRNGCVPIRECSG